MNKNILLLSIVFSMLFACQSSSNSSDEENVVETENTYTCSTCGATIPQSMLADGRAVWVADKNSPGGILHICSKCNPNSPAFENDEETMESDVNQDPLALNNYEQNYECTSCGTTHKEKDKNGDLHCLGCGEVLYLDY